MKNVFVLTFKQDPEDENNDYKIAIETFEKSLAVKELLGNEFTFNEGEIVERFNYPDRIEMLTVAEVEEYSAHYYALSYVDVVTRMVEYQVVLFADCVANSYMGRLLIPVCEEFRIPYVAVENDYCEESGKGYVTTIYAPNKTEV